MRVISSTVKYVIAVRASMLNISNGWFNYLYSLPHHSEPGDPILLSWVMEAIDRIIGLSPYLMLALLSCLVIAIPLTIVLCLRLFFTKDHDSNGNRPGNNPS